MRHPRFASAAVLVAAPLATLAITSAASGATVVPLGTTSDFALMAGSTITNTGITTINGDIGLCCTGVAVSGFGPGANSVTQPIGAFYVSPPAGPASIAQDDLDIAYANAAAQPAAILGVDLSLSGTPATPLIPGAYQSPGNGALQINTGLTLDFQGDPNAVFVFHGTTLDTAAGAAGSITIVNGGATPSACNIFWQLSDTATSVTLGTASAFRGTTMSLGASVLGAGATVDGRILTRRSKAVTTNNNTITRSTCAAPLAVGTPTPSAVPTTDVTPTADTAGTTTDTPAGPTTPATSPTAEQQRVLTAQAAARARAARAATVRRERARRAAQAAKRKHAAAAKRRAQQARPTPRPPKRPFGFTG